MMRSTLALKRRNGLLAGLTLAVGLLGTENRCALAAPLELLVTGSGGPTISIIDNGPLDTDPTIGSIQADTSILNAILLAGGSGYQFNTLGASSNSPGSASLATLSQTGQVQLTPGGTGSIRVLASDADYLLPSGVSNALLDSSSSTFTSAPAGDSQMFTSYFNPSNTLGATEVASPSVDLVSTGTLPNSQAGDAAPVSVSSLAPYGLSDTAIITLSGGAPGAPSQLQFAGTTAVTAPVAPVPLPAAVWGGLALLGVLGIGRARRHGRRIPVSW